MGTMKEYNKAVRDRIPEIIRSQGDECITKTVPDDAYLRYLEYKLIEELEEYLETKEPEELADLLEVIARVAELRGVSWEELGALRAKKGEERGVFSENIVLKSVEVDEPERKMLLCTCEQGDLVREDD